MTGVDTWTFARLAGHGNVKMSARYVHPNDDNVLVAMDRSGLPEFSGPSLSGPEFGHGAEIPLHTNGKWEPQLLDNKEETGGQCRTRTCDLLLVRQRCTQDQQLSLYLGIVTHRHEPHTWRGVPTTRIVTRRSA
jgi:hypothetical protein